MAGLGGVVQQDDSRDIHVKTVVMSGDIDVRPVDVSAPISLKMGRRKTVGGGFLSLQV
jgi:hypothetical protein